MSDRSRAMCFTFNNYTDDDVDRIRSVCQSCEYGVFQREVAPDTGTKHLQGFVYAKSAKTFSRWKSLIGDRAHLEKTRGSPQQASDYCKKEDSREPGTQPEEFGELPTQGRRSDLEAISEAITAGASVQEVATSHPGDFIRYHRGIEHFHALVQGRRAWKTSVIWLYGPTGTGKSYFASSRFPEAYWKMGTSKWWDGYYGESDVIIDDYRRDLCTFAELLRLFDRYPMLVERKGSSCNFLCRNLVITTPDSPRVTWEGRTEEAMGQLLRRIDEVWHFPAVGAEPVRVDVGTAVYANPVPTFVPPRPVENTSGFLSLLGAAEFDEDDLLRELDEDSEEEKDDDFWQSQGAVSLLGKRNVI